MAGVTLALALASGGLKPLLIDPQLFEDQCAPSFDGRASAISFSAFRQWRALGVAPFLEPHAQRIEQILVTQGGGPGLLRFAADEIAARNQGEPLGYMLENRHIRAGLASAAAEAGIEVLAPQRVVSAQTSGAAARIGLEDGRTLTAPLIVGADGRGSLIRREAHIATQGWGYGQSGVVATVGVERDHAGVAYEHFLPAGPFAILPLTGRRVSLVWTESTARGAALAQASPEAFAAHLGRRFGSFLGQIEVLGPRFVYPLSLQLAERLVAPRVALIGDAAHAIHPIAGQGLNMGLKDAAALAQVLTEAARLGEDIGALDVLERYARWRGVDNVGVALATDLFTRLYSNNHPLVRIARGVGMAAVGAAGPLRRLFMHEAGGALGDLPRLLRGEAL